MVYSFALPMAAQHIVNTLCTNGQGQVHVQLATDTVPESAVPAETHVPEGLIQKQEPKDALISRAW